MNCKDRNAARKYLKRVFDVYIEEQVYEPNSLREDMSSNGQYLHTCLQEQLRDPLFNHIEFTSLFGHGDTDEKLLRTFITSLDAFIFADGAEPDVNVYFA